MASNKVTLRDFLKMQLQGRRGYYKGCLIDSMAELEDGYWFLVLNLPDSVGLARQHSELADLDAEITLR